MVAPNPQLRISPSGPLTTATTNPLAEYSGAIFQSEYGEAEHIARIGPEGTFVANEAVCYLVRAGNSAPQPSVAPKIITPMYGAPPSEDVSEAFEFGKGIWLVEAVITCGFNTSEANAVDQSGALRATFSLLKDDGAASSSFPTPLSLIPNPGGDAAVTNSMTAIHTMVFQATMEVTEAHISDNNNLPLRGLSCMLERLDSIEAIAQTYSTASGWLEFTSDCALKIRRFR